MQTIDFLLPVLYVVVLWWFTTGVIIAVYPSRVEMHRLAFLGATVALCAALWGLWATRGDATPMTSYIALTCGVVIWGWQVTGYYLGFVTGPHLDEAPAEDLTLVERFGLALRFSIYHELLAVAFGVLIAVLTWGQPNQWALWIYVALWVMHASAKLNVFLGVRNFRVDLLPEKMHALDSLLNKRSHNALFPVSVVVGSAVALMLIYRGIMPGTDPLHTVGYLTVGTMIGLGVLEHWMLVLPLPAVMWGWTFQQVQSDPPMLNTTITGGGAAAPQTAAPRSRGSRRKHIITYQLKHGPLVVDVWEPSRPLDVPPVLLIHGWGGTGNYWHKTAFDLSATARVIVPDLPGTGRSQPVSRAQNMFDQVAALEHILDELVRDNVQLVGHSMGGAMALLLADAHPERVERLVLTSLGFFMKQSEVDAFNFSMKFFRLTMPFRQPWLVAVPGMPQLMAMQYFHRIPRDAEVLERGLLDFLEIDAGTAMACADNATDPIIKEAGARVQAPTLIIGSRNDRVMPVENIEYTSTVIPNSTIRWIDRCGHLPMVEKRTEYTALLRKFLELE